MALGAACAHGGGGGFTSGTNRRSEVKMVVFAIEEDKAPGPDGFSAGFYKAAWPVIENDITVAVHDFFLTRARAFGRVTRYHRTCLFLLWRADEHSVMLFRDRLQLFAEWSGLQANVSKSQIIVSKSALDIKPRLLAILGFQEGVLPVRYLGLPLISSRLTVSDCRPLITKVEERLAGIAKVVWSDVCRPLEEGVKESEPFTFWNKGLMCKNLWDVVQHNSESIWVTWIYQYRLKQLTVWTANPNTGSWSWRKILRLRNQLIDHIRCTVGMGLRLRYGRTRGTPLVCSSTDSHGDLRVITDTLLPLEGVDRICWNGSNEFTTREAYHLFQPAGPKGQDRSCVLCTRGIAETHDHLFFQCDYSRQCLQILRSKVRFSLPFRTWRPNVDCAARHWRGRHPLNAACRALLASLV
ncbi:UNVERIFIED_CONTAM: hypothetical protein Slati_1367800 [Sesamum latifolium]|uniref:Reverse transcriptase zinc-binding domain-containing protein n=1 Tax=Sesamum latifolium TaxID=2727402 RepID=A0AAW2XI97_9LAMI